MPKTAFYRQCRLRKVIPTGSVEQVSYLPEPFCTVGRQLTLRHPKNGAWDDGWIVVSAGEKQPAEHVEARERDYLKTRRASDI